ncbi:hypothetical protein J4Q44_G00238030 [Coregonus suidteri]|uniref:Uncharacterized protein n=1 Tax=Coregonus suidteri TaxID=861788 RepID=A0AAN8L5S9_9TELE
MIITQVHLVLGTIKGLSKMCSFVTQHNATDVSSFERACNLHADCRNGHQSCCFNVNFSTISRLQSHFREFGSTFNRPHNRRPRVWRCVSEWFADVNIVNRVLHSGSWVMVWAGRQKLRTTNTIAFYRWQFQCTEIP